MKESWKEELATHLHLNSYADDGDIVGVASGRGTGRPAIELRNQHFRVPTLWCLYVAMTRARSLLGIYGINGGSPAARKLNDTISHCINTLNSPPQIERASSDKDDFRDILSQIGDDHRHWLKDIWERFEVIQEPITDSTGKVMAEPIFWFASNNGKHACFCEALSKEILAALAQQSIEAIFPGQNSTKWGDGN